ncbi:MAG: hypothetical protein R3E87_19630 [Burkholderiaceae bacterium]
MIVLNALWWLTLGLLMGWAGLWLFDRLMLRDGEVAGLRAAREMAEMRSRHEEQVAELSVHEREATTLRGSLEQAAQETDLLQAQLAESRLQRARLEQDLTDARNRETSKQTDLDESRRTIAERASEIERLKNQLHEVNHQRDAADRWGQAKDNEAADLRKRLDTLQAEHDSQRSELEALRASSSDQERVLAAVQASYDSLETEHQRLAALLPGLRHDVQAARRQVRELARRGAMNPGARARQSKRLAARLNRVEAGVRDLDALDAMARRRRRLVVAPVPGDAASSTGDRPPAAADGET